mgnify:CR=1 FL=1
MTTRSGLAYNAIQRDSGENVTTVLVGVGGRSTEDPGGQPAVTGRGGGASEGGGG